MRLASVPSISQSHPYYQPYAPFPGPTPYQYSSGWVQAAPPQVDVAPGVYASAGGYTYGIPQPPQSHTSSTSDPFSRKRPPPPPPPPDSDHSSNYSQHHHTPYQHSRNPSLTSIAHVHPDSDPRVKSQSREPSSAIPHCYPTKTSSSSSSSGKRVRIAPLLSGRTTEYPSIDWHIWDKLHASAARDVSGQFCATDLELEAFDPPIREPIFIKGVPGKSDGFSIAVQRWGPIRVSPRRPGSAIVVNDIMLAISLWVTVPIQPEDWKSFDKVFEKHVGDAFESRRVHSKTQQQQQRLLSGCAKDRAQVVDSLFCRVRWDGMVVSDEFAESRTVYLRLKDASLRC